MLRTVTDIVNFKFSLLRPALQDFEMFPLLSHTLEKLENCLPVVYKIISQRHRDLVCNKVGFTLQVFLLRKLSERVKDETSKHLKAPQATDKI